MSYERFGPYLRNRRIAKGVSVNAIAAIAGCEHSYLYRIERGECPPPVEDKIKAIAEALDCDSDCMLALAGRISSDVLAIMLDNPIEATSMVRSFRCGVTDHKRLGLCRAG